MAFSLCGTPALAYADDLDEAVEEIPAVEEALSVQEVVEETAEETSVEPVAAVSEEEEAADAGVSTAPAGTDEEPESPAGSVASLAAEEALAQTSIAAQPTAAAEWAEILAGCSVTMNRSESFTVEDDGVEVSVQLHETVGSCYLTIFAYAANTAFDPDASQNIRLWEGRVTDGQTLTCPFKEACLPLSTGYKVIACLNVPVDEDFYRPVNSAPLEVVDESGETFVDYVYPDATIDETTLEAGTTALHVSLTGDERLFAAAREGKATLTVSVAQYPADATFDFESEEQIPLCSPINVTDVLNGYEVQLSEPLREGYRVRAVVYWGQNPDLLLVKGNDYESVFNRPDDSVLVAPSSQPAVTFSAPVNAGDTAVELQLTGAIPGGSLLLVKSYGASETPVLWEGTILATGISAEHAGTYSVDVAAALQNDTQLVAYLLNNGVVAQSAPVAVLARDPYRIQLASPLTADATSVTLTVEALDAALEHSQINAVQLFPVEADGSVDLTYSNAIAGVFGQYPGAITIGLNGKTPAAGSKVCVRITYAGADKMFLSEPFTVGAPMVANDVVIEGAEVAADADELVVNVSGYSEMVGGLLILTTGTAATAGDADSRTQLGTVRFTGAGIYRIPIAASRLAPGQIVQAHLYRYDADADATFYRYGNALPVVAAASAVTDAVVSIVTQNITADRSDLWAEVNFDAALTGSVALYCHDGSLWTAADLVWSGAVQPQENSQRIIFGADRLLGGRNLTAVLTLSDGTTVVSESVPVLKTPEAVAPVAVIKDPVVTAGMTTLRASLTFDTKAQSARYVLYRFAADGSPAVELTSGVLYAPATDRSLYLGVGKIAPGDLLQVVLTVDGVVAESNAVEVQPSPDWGTPYVALGAPAAQSTDRAIPVTVDYADEYLAMDDFYCDVSVYEVSASYSDDQIENLEIWENFGQCRRVGQLNSTLGDVTRGSLSVPVLDGVSLTPGCRLFVKVRLPHVEWAGEEVDYVSASIPVLAEGEALPATKVLLYNLGSDTARGAQVREMLAALGVPVETISVADLHQEIGYLAGLTGFEKAEGAFEGSAPTTEFMLMCGMGEALLDQFLDCMQTASLRIDHKAIVTEYNRYYTLAQLIGDIEEEHETFQALLALDKALAAAEALSEEEYGAHSQWLALQQAIDRGSAVLGSDEPELEDLVSCTNELLTLVAEITGQAEPAPLPTPSPVPQPQPVPAPAPAPGPETNVGGSVASDGSDSQHGSSSYATGDRAQASHRGHASDADRRDSRDGDRATGRSEAHGGQRAHDSQVSHRPDEGGDRVVRDEGASRAQTHDLDVDAAVQDPKATDSMADDATPLAAPEAESAVPAQLALSCLIALAVGALIVAVESRRRADQASSR